MSTITATQKIAQAEPIKIGSEKKNISLKRALKCAYNPSTMSQIWNRFICFFLGYGIVNQKYVATLVNNTDPATTRKLLKLLSGAQKRIADKDKPDFPADQKKAVEEYSKRAEKDKLFLALLKEESLTRFANKDSAVLTLVKALPDAKKEKVIKLANDGFTAPVLFSQFKEKAEDKQDEVLKKILENENFVASIDGEIGLSKPKADSIPEMKNVIEALKSGLLASIQKGISFAKVTKDPVKKIKFTDEEVFVSQQPTNDVETLEILKTVLTQKSSHIVTLGYPSLNLPSVPDTEKKFGETITVKLQKQSLEKPATDQAIGFVVKTFIITDSSVKEADKPLSRTIDVLSLANWPATGSPKIEEVREFLNLDQKTVAEQEENYRKNPVIISGNDTSHLGTFLAMRQSKPNAEGEFPILKNLKTALQFLGKEFCPQSVEEVASIFGLFKPVFSQDELALLKPLKTNLSKDEKADDYVPKHFLNLVNPGKQPTELEIFEAEVYLSDLDLFTTCSLQKANVAVTLLKEKISAQDLLKILAEKSKTYAPLSEVDLLEFPDVVEEALAEFRKVHSERVTALAKELFKDLTGDALKAKEELISNTFRNLASFEEFLDVKSDRTNMLNSAKELLEHKVSLPEFFKSLKTHYDNLPEELKNKFPMDQNPLDNASFKELLSTLQAKAEAK